MVKVPGGSAGRLVWELMDTSTGEVRSGERELRLADFEVLVSPPPVPPHLNLLQVGPRRVIADSLSWLVRAGRGSATKRVQLADGFWLVLRELRTPSRSSLVLLSAKRDGARLSCVERFRVDDGGTTATQADGTGLLELEWAQDGDGFQELVSTAVVTDVTLRLRSARGPVGRAPVWHVRILAGSRVQWRSSADGVQLVPRLRPNRGRPADTS